MSLTTPLGGRRPPPLPPPPAADGGPHLDADTVLRRIKTIAAAVRDPQGGTMVRAELLAAAREFRDERGRMHDTAAHLLLTEVVCHLERDSAAARAELLRRVKALRDERARTHDPVLLLLLAEIIADLEREMRAARGPTRGYCEFCGTEDGECAVCGGEL